MRLQKHRWELPPLSAVNPLVNYTASEDTGNDQTITNDVILKKAIEKMKSEYDKLDSVRKLQVLGLKSRTYVNGTKLIGG